MDRDRLLSAVSAAQLTAGVAGMAVALKRRHPYDVPLLHGRADAIPRDALLMGTALSAPVVMLTAQGVAVAQLRRDPSPRAAKVLGALGATMVVGYLAESLGRRRLLPSSWDRVESPLVAIGTGLAATMAVLGLSSRRDASHRNA